MGFGRNPHVAKAEAAQQKAEIAKDASAYERAWREAGHLWDRAAEREPDAKRRSLYAANAERARASADAPQASGDEDLPSPESPESPESLESPGADGSPVPSDVN